MSGSKRNLEPIRKMLLQRKVELEDKLTQLSKEKIVGSEVQDPGDQALSSTMETLRTSWQDTELEEFKRILKALQKIDDGTYGICVDCGQPIAERRLKSFPNASRCLPCQETFEEQQ